MAMELAPTRNSHVGGSSAFKKEENVNRIDFQRFEKYFRSEILKFSKITEVDREKEENESGLKIASFLGIKLF